MNRFTRKLVTLLTVMLLITAIGVMANAQTLPGGAQAQTITQGQGYSFQSAGQSEGNYYSFTPGKTDDYTITSYDRDSGDPYVVLYDAQLQELGRADDQAGKLNFMLTMRLTAGATYYLEVRNVSSSSANFKFSVEPTPVVSITAEPIVLGVNSGGFWTGYWDENGNLMRWYQYEWQDQLCLNVVTADGKTIRNVGDTFSYNGKDYVICGDFGQNYETQMLPGETYQKEVTLLGKTALVSITIKNPSQAGGFEYLVNSGKAIICGSSRTDTALTIPQKLGGYPVTAVESLGEAIRYAKQIVIPDCVTQLGKNLFHGAVAQKITVGKGVTNYNWKSLRNATDLAQIQISSNNPSYTSVDGVVYDKAVKKLLFAPRAKTTQLRIPDSVTDVENLMDGIAHYKNLNVVFGAGVKNYVSIDGIVYNKNVTTLHYANKNTIGDHKMASTVTNIGEKAFANSAYTSVTVSPKVTELVYGTFMGCTNLREVTLPENLESIGVHAFFDCTSLQAIVIPAGVKNIQPAFDGSAIDHIFYKGTQAQWQNVEKYFDYGRYTIHYNATGNEMTLQTQGTQLKMYCSICKEWSVISNPAKMTGWYEQNGKWYYYKNGARATIWLATTKQNGRITITDCNTATSGALSIPSTLGGYPVTAIGDSAFDYCTKLTKVVIPSSVKTIGDSAFDNCTALASVTIPNGITSIGFATFYNCKSLTSVVIPSSVTTIGARAFESCTSLARVNIPSSVKTIGSRAFANCPKLNSAKLTTSLVNGYAAEGKVASVTVKATGDGLTYTWYHKNASAAAYTKSSVTSATYSTKITSSSNGRYVYCVVRDRYGNTVQTNKVRLWRGNTVKLTTALVNGYAPEGKIASVTVKATGDGLTYTWYHKNANAAAYAKSSVTSATYSTKITSSSNGRYVYCVVRDRYGNVVQTNKVRLWRGNPAKISVQPVSPVVQNGKTATVTIKATGDGLSYTWYHKSATASAYAKSSATGVTYSVKMTASTKGRYVYCVVRDKYGNTVKSNVVTLKMK